MGGGPWYFPGFVQRRVLEHRRDLDRNFLILRSYFVFVQSARTRVGFVR